VKKLTVEPKVVVPVVPSYFVGETRDLLKQLASVLDFVGGLELEDMEQQPMLAVTLFGVLRTRLAPAQEEIAKLCGESAAENRNAA
jgi:hypothetical protein